MDNIRITTEVNDTINILLKQMEKLNCESRAHIFQILDAFYCQGCGLKFSQTFVHCSCKRDE